MLRRLSDNRGFTLTELVVAMSLGMIVLLAAFTVIDRSFKTNKDIVDRTDALSRGRIVLELMTRQIRSMTCAGQNTPVALGTDNELDFYGYMGDPTVGSTLPQLHKLVYDPTAKKLTATDYAVTSVDTTPPTVSTTPVNPTKTLLTNVVPNAAGDPIFTYWTYDAGATQGTGTFSKLTAGSSGLSSTDRPRVVKVALNFLTRPTGVNASDPHATTFQDDVFWRAVDPENPNAQPCSQGP
jgi:prepilin-type N-terminal cleavage/methylation domain-containing protein